MTDPAFAILVEVLLALIVVIVVLGNLFVIQAVCRHVRLKTIPNICITSLAFADLIVGLLNVPMYMYAVYVDAFEKNYSEKYTLALNSLDMYFGVTSILHLALISMERCYAITYPLRRRFLQKATVIKILVCVWLLEIIPVVLFVLNIPYNIAAILIGCFLVPLVVIITSYIILVISARRSWSKMKEYRVQETAKDFKLAKTLCIVIAIFVVTWTPFFILVLISNYPDYFTWNLTLGQLTYFAYFVKFLQYASSACNPFIYAFRQREFKHALYDFCGISSSTSHNLVHEDSQSSTRITRTFVHRHSKSSDRNEQIHLHRLNNVNGAGGEHCTN